MLHCNGVNPFVTLMGNFKWVLFSSNDVMSTWICVDYLEICTQLLATHVKMNICTSLQVLEMT